MTILDSPPRAALQPRLWSSGPLAPLLAGALATVATGIGSGVPSMWGDEAASVMSAQRSWESLWAMAGNVDAVHTLYYGLLHLWIDVFGASAFSVRLPSVIAVGAVVAGIFVLCRMLASPATAVLASLLCVLIPRVGFMAAEARSSALAAAVVTWLTVVLVRIVRNGDRRLPLLILYGAGMALSIHIFLYSGLIVVAHAIALVIFLTNRRLAKDWLVTTGIAFLLCVPFALLCFTQRGQVAFLAHRDVTSAAKILVNQWFGDLTFAIPAWALIAISIVVAARRPRVADDRARPYTTARADAHKLTALAAAWLFAPMGVLLLANAIVGPLYTGRYVSFSAPAAAILMALAIMALRPLPVRLAATALVLALALPLAVEQRGPYAKFGSDWAQISEHIEAEGEPGDGIVFDENVRPSRKPRLALRLYPEGFQNVTDLGLVRDYGDTSHLWDQVSPLDDLPHALVDHDRIWVVSRSAEGTAQDQATLERSGYRLTATRQLCVNVIRLYEKDPT